MPDWAYPIVLLGFFAIVATVFAWRFSEAGSAPRYARVEREGGGALLGKRSMAMAYWAIQPLGSLLVALGISANAVTWTSLALGCAAGVALAFGAFGLAALLGTLSFFCDAIDGLVARAAGTASPAGEVLDASIDRWVEFAFLAGLCVHYHQSPLLLALSLLALQGGFMVSYASAKAEALHADVPRGAMRRVERCVYLILGATLTALIAPWSLAFTARGVSAELPMLAALLLIAVVGNGSAALRLRCLARSVGGSPVLARAPRSV